MRGYNGGMGASSRLTPILISFLVAVAGPILYFLSIGPVAYLSSAGYIEYRAGSAIVYFYAPLFWTGRTCEQFDAVLTWYIHLWTDS